ncbi:hypothetical protein AMELA_G00264940 [Ameiurus melas]|uniref:Uncharacterized protein n=1 Tax=Ameiurus melas TaxID=219545 RepID=A0A7J5ZQ66_AMEME|nr:hypothetical protein AMELA_G00264940 [Ameiurus melas]
MHPLMVAIITTNTSLSVILWNFLLSQVFCKKIKDAPRSEEERNGRGGSMPSPEFQYKELENGSVVSRRPLQEEAIHQDERYFSEYIPSARDAIVITPKYLLYVLIGAVVIIVGTYSITSHLIKDLLHDLADWVLGPDLEENEEEEEVEESSGREDWTGAAERKGKREENHKATGVDEKQSRT